MELRSYWKKSVGKRAAPSARRQAEMLETVTGIIGAGFRRPINFARRVAGVLGPAEPI